MLKACFLIVILSKALLGDAVLVKSIFVFSSIFLKPLQINLVNEVYKSKRTTSMETTCIKPYCRIEPVNRYLTSISGGCKNLNRTLTSKSKFK